MRTRTPAGQHRHEQYLELKAKRHAAGVTSNGKPWKPAPSESELVAADRERFRTLFTKGAGDACWEWSAGRNRFGYGKFTVTRAGKKSTMGAHRYAYLAEFGEIPTGLLACHECDNPGCVRPSHLWLGTPADNMDDKVRKGRQSRGQAHSDAIMAKPRTVLRGSQTHVAKLTESDIPELRKMHASGASLAETAARFGVAKQTVLNAANRKTWRHVA